MQRAASLRFSLLMSLGLVPLACGGTTQDGDDNPAKGGAGSGGSAGKAGAATAGNAQGGTITAVPCTAPTKDPLTGLVTCKEGYVHRPQAVACGVTLQKAAPPGGSAGIGAPEPSLPRANGEPCEEDPTVCSAFEYGYCGSEGGGAAPSVCRSGCVTDNDCGTGSLCRCGSSASPTSGVCVTSSCRTDVDCGGYFCAAYDTGCSGQVFACQTQDDACRADADCNGGACFPSAEGVWTCGGICVAGRPFLVAEKQRVAPPTARADWLELTTPRTDHLSHDERASQARHWTKLGQMEHASVAAFARFSLQLLALGAPADLVEACTAALADETAHAKLCFGIASAYAGRSIGPGPLDVSNSLELTSLSDIVDLVIAEGCIGETSAALEALEAAESAADPVIRAAYRRIAADEQRHAELAFRFVRWALAREPGLAARVDAALGACSATSNEGRAVVAAVLDALLAERASFAA
jgi:hypothetical protein